MDHHYFNRFMFEVSKTLEANKELTLVTEECVKYFKEVERKPYILQRPEPRDISHQRSDLENRLQQVENLINQTTPNPDGDDNTASGTTEVSTDITDNTSHCGVARDKSTDTA